MKTLITENELHDGVARLAQQVSDQYRDKPLMMIGILQDSIVLMADLMRMMDIPSQVRIVQPVVDHVGPVGDSDRSIVVIYDRGAALPSAYRDTPPVARQVGEPDHEVLVGLLDVFAVHHDTNGPTQIAGVEGQGTARCGVVIV